MNESPTVTVSPATRERCAWWDRVLGWAAVSCTLAVVSAGTAFAAAASWQQLSLIEECVALARSAAPRHTAAAGPHVAASTSLQLASREPAALPSRPRHPGAQSSSTAATPLASDPAEASEHTISVGLSLPPAYTRTECEDVFVYIVTVAEAAPAHSAASLGLGKTGRARFRQPGQSLGGWEVLGITDDWTGVDPAVWLAKDRSICRAELAGNPARIHAPLREPQKRQRPRRKARRRR